MSERVIVECDGCGKDLTRWGNSGSKMRSVLFSEPRQGSGIKDYTDKSPLHFCDLPCIRLWANRG